MTWIVKGNLKKYPQYGVSASSQYGLMILVSKSVLWQLSIDLDMDVQYHSINPWQGLWSWNWRAASVIWCVFEAIIGFTRTILIVHGRRTWSSNFLKTKYSFSFQCYLLVCTVCSPMLREEFSLRTATLNLNDRDQWKFQINNSTGTFLQSFGSEIVACGTTNT